MDHAVPLPYLRETLLFLALAGVLIPLLQRFRVNQVLGFLLMGVLLGPFGVGSLVGEHPWLAWVSFPRQQGVQALAELGVIFLMFLIGLEMSLPHMWAMRRWVLGTGTAQVLLCAAAIGAAAWAFGNSVRVAVVLGLVLSLSSTAVVMQLLTQNRLVATPLGQAAFAVLLLQDLAVVPLLIVVGLLAREPAAGLYSQLAVTGLVSVGVVAALLLGGRFLVPRLFRTFASHRQAEVFVALTLLVTLGAGVATAAAGLSMALGALLAGLLLAETEYRHEVELTIEPFKGLLMGLFFMSVGMGIDVRELAREPRWLLASVLGLFAIKGAIVAGLLRIGGLSWGHAVHGGLLLGQGGEFAFIVIGTALAAGLLDASTGQFMLLVVSVSLLLTPLLARLGQWLGGRIDAGRPMEADGELPVPTTGGHVVVIGFGRVGRLLGEVFERQHVAYLALDRHVERVGRLRAQGLPVYWGNASRPELLNRLGLERAACLVVTMDEPAAARRVVRNARQHFPQLPIFARSQDERHAGELVEAGATLVVPEVLEAGLQLSALALAAMGEDEAEVQDLLIAERERRLREAASPAPGSS